MITSKKRVYDPCQDYVEFLKVLPSMRERKKQIPDHCMLIRKVVVTPTRILFMAPAVSVWKQFYVIQNDLTCNNKLYNFMPILKG
jgi:hypothetical protein